MFRKAIVAPLYAKGTYHIVRQLSCSTSMTTRDVTTREQGETSGDDGDAM